VRYHGPEVDVPATIDEALELLEDTGPEFAGGLANHGPMAAEALVALGRDDAVVPWVERYRTRLQDHPSARSAIDPRDWREALGQGERVGDWIAFFDRQLAEAPWPQVLNTWVERLAPGIVASATHGVIRTGHAVRALSQEETPLRLHELAKAWATGRRATCSFQERLLRRAARCAFRRRCARRAAARRTAHAAWGDHRRTRPAAGLPTVCFDDRPHRCLRRRRRSPLRSDGDVRACTSPTTAS
jgi:hypothetical protein